MQNKYLLNGWCKTMAYYENVYKELDNYYGKTDMREAELVSELDRVYESVSDKSIYRIRAEITDWLCKNCDIHLFKTFPFFAEMVAGRHRHTWGGLGSYVGRYLFDKNADKWLNKYYNDTETDRAEGFLHNWNNPVGIDHFCLGYDRILNVGFEQIISDIEGKLGKADLTDEEREFLEAAKQSCESFLVLAGRFSALACELSKQAEDEAQREHYAKISAAAARVPARPAQTLYEAMCAVFFCRECISTLEGFGVSTWGHLDRMLYPFYKADLQAGRITEEEASWLFHMLLTYTDARFESETQYNETSTTIILGGCDALGKPIFNDVTRFILKAVLKGRYISTKINCRISSGHPSEYFDLLSEIQLADLAVFVMQNDEVIIPALVKRGIEDMDARLYVGGGCHEILPANTSVCTRADTWISLPRLVLEAIDKAGEVQSFEEFYDLFLETVQNYILRIEGLKNKYEVLWKAYSPMPLCSSTLTGCVETCRDLTAGGAKYSNTALSLLGVGTFVDSLFSVKNLVFDEKKLTMKELNSILKSDFEGNERLRQYILHRIPKYGTGEQNVDSFAAKVLADISEMFGQKNGRGGDYLPAIYPHDIFRNLGGRCGATPDGRRSGEYLSRGCSPSETVEVKSPLDIMQTIGKLDLTNYAESVCTEITLPKIEGETGKTAFKAIVFSFLQNGGSSLQFNLINRDLLLEAQKDPEHHGDIIVRVCGYSAVFVALDEERQTEVISRAVRDY